MTGAPTAASATRGRVQRRASADGRAWRCARYFVVAIGAALATSGFAQESHFIGLFPAFGGADEDYVREGFVRVINRGGGDGVVSIEGVDDAGQPAGPVTLRLGAGRTVHFNSKDFEQGNANKGLSEGVGPPSQGDWRLTLTSTLDIEALPYLRTIKDGFLTSMRDLAPVADGNHRVVVFNPARNENQVSQLRLINPGAEAADVVIRGVDDHGEAGDSDIRLSLPGHAARTYTAKHLEEGHADLQGALGAGAGKWRLTVESEASLHVMSLLLSEKTGRLANLSSVPGEADVSGETKTHHVPLFPAKDDPGGRQGFLRVVNRAEEDVTVRITAFDDTGNARPEITLQLGHGRTVHFNSIHLEDGNAAKGLSAGVGDGEGDWRLQLAAEQDIAVYVYIRTEDGFLTSMHDVVPVTERRQRVAFFNPARNENQRSVLRVVNTGEAEETVTVRGTDDAGEEREEITFTVPALGAYTFFAKDLEEGHADLAGALGAGAGKWQLEVEANPAVRTMSLLLSPTGHLTNLSTALPFPPPPPPPPTETSADVFEDSISEPIVQGRCVNCHVIGGPSGGTRLVFVRARDDADHLEANRQAFINLLSRTNSGKGLVLDKVRGLRGHGGGPQLAEDSEDYANLKRFLTLLEAEMNAGGSSQPPALATNGVGHPMLVSPHSKPIAASGGYVYVANTPADTVDVLDAATRRVVKRIDVGVDPVSVAVRPDGREVWVANHVSDTVSVIDADAASRSFHEVIATIQDIDAQTLSTRFDEPVGIAFASASKAYVALSTANQVAIVDAREHAVTGRLAIRAQDPRALVARGDRLYVIPFESNNQSQLSGCRAEDIDGDVCTFDAVQHVFTTNNVLSLGYDADIVKNPRIPDRDIFVFDTRTDEQIDVVHTAGTLLYGIAVDGNGRVFVAQTDARNVENGRAGTRKHGLAEMENRAFLNQITRVNCRGSCGQPTFFDLEPLPPAHPAAGMALATPFGIQVTEDDAALVVTAAGSDKVFTVDADSGEVLGRVAVEAAPRGIALVSDADGAARQAWVLNAVANSVSLVDLSSLANPAVVDTIALVDPTDPVVKQGRIAFNDADASSTGTFSCESCHPDGHTDQLIWVLQTPACDAGGGNNSPDYREQLAAGCTQVPPRLTMPVRGLRDTQPYHWDGIPGDPYGGTNTASVLAPVEPNCDVRRPETCTRQLVDGSLATTMCDLTNCPDNEEGKAGLLDGATRDALAAFILNIPYPPAQTRPFDNALTPQARAGFFEFSYLNDSSGRTTGAQTCGACHRPPFLVSTNTPGTGMDAPTWRGANDRFIITPQARTNVIDLMRLVNMDDTFPERNIWILGGATPDIWEMVLEGSTGFAGAFGRQVTLNARSAGRPQTGRVLNALETAAAEDAVVLQAEGVRLQADGGVRRLALQFADGRYVERDGDGAFSRAELRRAADRGELFLTITGRAGPNVAPHFPQPGLWPIGEIHAQTVNLDMPMLGDDATLRLHSRHVHPGASVFLNGRRVAGAVRCESGALPRCDGETVIVEFWDAPESGGLHFLQVQNPGGLFSNDLMFFNETVPQPPRPGNLIYSGGDFEWRHWDNHLGPLWRGEPRSHWNTVELDGNTVDVPDRGAEVRVNVRAVNTSQPWRAQLSHGVLVTRGQEYTLCYDARAAGERFITAYMDTNLNRWRNISGGQFRAELSTEWQTFRHTFTVHETDMTARVAFDFAQSNLRVDIDNVGLYEGSECGVP